jgi:putative membrane protein
MADGRAAETSDALRRTRLATERTYLAWWRTGLTSVAVGVGAGGIAPKLAGERHWAYVTLGIGFATLGVALLAYGLRRQVEVDRAVNEGGFSPPDARVLTFLTVAAGILGALTVILLFSTF